MALIRPLVVMATMLVAVVSAADTSCKGEGWESKTLEQRASEAKWVAYIQVASDEMHVMAESDVNISTSYEVVVNITCWFKKGPGSMGDDDGAPETGDAPKTGDAPDADDTADGDTDQDGYDGNMTVPDAGQNITIVLEKVICKSQTLKKGMKYVLFMEAHMDGMFKIVNVNDQPGALDDLKDDDFQALHRGIDSGMEGKPDGECVDGVNIPCFEPKGEYDKKACDVAASLTAMVATVVVAAVLAIATF